MGANTAISCFIILGFLHFAQFYLVKKFSICNEKNDKMLHSYFVFIQQTKQKYKCLHQRIRDAAFVRSSRLNESQQRVVSDTSQSLFGDDSIYESDTNKRSPFLPSPRSYF